MARHRGFTRKKFLEAVGADLVEEFLAGRIEEVGVLDDFSDGAVAELLQQQVETVRKQIDEEFHCINDVAEKGMDYLDRACSEFSEPVDDEWSRERLAMYLYLRKRDVFGTAYDWYVWRKGANNLSHHQFTAGDPQFTDEAVAEFAEAVRCNYQQQSKGEGCRVRHYVDDDGTHVILVARGDYLHTQMIWEKDEVATSIVRPAKEDVLCFLPANRVLSLKTSGRSVAERENYIRAFGRHLFGLEEVPPEVFECTAVSLEPIRNGSFNYWGNEQIEWVALIEVQMKISGSQTTKIRLNGIDLVAAIHDDLPSFALTRGEVQSAKLKFKINCDGASCRARAWPLPPWRN